MNSMKLYLTSQGTRGTDLFCRLQVKPSLGSLWSKLGRVALKRLTPIQIQTISSAMQIDFTTVKDIQSMRCWVRAVQLPSRGTPPRSGLPRCPSERKLSQLIPNLSKGVWVPSPSVLVADCNRCVMIFCMRLSSLPRLPRCAVDARGQKLTIAITFIQIKGWSPVENS